MHVLVAPQEFKGSLSAEEAADAIARGIRRARPEWTIELLPMSDGGPGLLESLRRAIRCDTLAAVVHDALGRKVLARYAIVRATREVIIEAAQANGLMHIAPGERDALRADTFGVGEIILDAVSLAPPRIIVGVGGSATTDGGAGMARALGARLLDAHGNGLPPGGAALARLARIEWRPPAWLESTDIVVATDVTSPLTGREGAARIFGPQKGATPADVETLESALEHYSVVVTETLGRDVADLPGAGAAGGLAAGLVAFLGARIESGFDVVAAASNLHERLASADLVLTGEGSFDGQSLKGKVTGRLLALADAAGKPAIIFAGRTDSSSPDIHTISSIQPDAGAAMRDASELLTRLAFDWAAAVTVQSAIADRES